MVPTVAAQPSGATIWDYMAITKSLSDENRVRMLLALRGRELCAGVDLGVVGNAAGRRS